MTQSNASSPSAPLTKEQLDYIRARDLGGLGEPSNQSACDRRMLLQYIDHLESLAPQSLEAGEDGRELQEALESGVALLIQEGLYERSLCSSYDIGTPSFIKHDSRARLAARQADLLAALASRLSSGDL